MQSNAPFIHVFTIKLHLVLQMVTMIDELMTDEKRIATIYYSSCMIAKFIFAVVQIIAFYFKSHCNKTFGPFVDVSDR